MGLTIQPVTGSVFAVEQDQIAMVLPVIRGYQHKIVLKEDVTLIHHNLQQLPLSLREEVSEEPHSLLGQGVIEPLIDSMVFCYSV